MSRRDFVLPPEALALVKLVADLEARAERVRTELAADLAGIRQAAELEVEEARRHAADERREAAQRLNEIRRAGEAEQARSSRPGRTWRITVKCSKLSCRTGSAASV
jgi:hypothetical protein